MKKKYSRTGSRSSRKCQRRARRKEHREVDGVIQLSLPLVELLASARESLGRFVVDVGMNAVAGHRVRLASVRCFSGREVKVFQRAAA